jgi:hypothetical protein
MAEVVQLHEVDTLADRINAEHGAYEAGIKAALGQIEDALDHAVAAGDLLLQAKAECKHGNWTPWLGEHFKGSVRRAQEYMYLAERREHLEEVKSAGTAFSSISDAFEYLRLVTREAKGVRPVDQPTIPGPSVPGVFTSELPIETKARRVNARAEQKLLRKAEHAIRIGNHSRPADLTAWERKNWWAALHKALDARTENLPNVLDNLAHQLNILTRHVDPDQVAAYLTEQRVGYEEAEGRADQLAELRDGAAWLDQVLQAAEQAQGQ